MSDLYRLLSLRKSLSLSQKDVAAAINITREAYSMYETGHRKPPFEIMVSLAEYYGVSIDYLAGISDVRESYAKYSPKQRFIAKNISALSAGSINIIIAVIREELIQPSF